MTSTGRQRFVAASRYWIATSLPRRGSGAPRRLTRPLRCATCPVRSAGGATRREMPVRTRRSSERRGRRGKAAVAREEDGDPARGSGCEPQLEAAARAASRRPRPRQGRGLRARAGRATRRCAAAEAGPVGPDETAAEPCRRLRRARSAPRRGGGRRAAARRGGSFAAAPPPSATPTERRPETPPTACGSSSRCRRRAGWSPRRCQRRRSPRRGRGRYRARDPGCGQSGWPARRRHPASSAARSTRRRRRAGRKWSRRPAPEWASATAARTCSGTSAPPSLTKATVGGTSSKRSGSVSAEAGESLPASSRSQTRST